MYDILVIAYLFLGGTSGGTYCVMAAWSLLFHRRNAEHSQRLRGAFGALLKRVYAVALLLSIAASFCLIQDLIYPERAFLIFFRPRPTLLTFGAYALGAQVIVGTALFLANGFALRIIGGFARKALECVAVVLSLCTMLYTGLFLASNTSIPFWNTPWLAAMLLFSSLSSGVSLMLLIDYFAQNRVFFLHAARPLQKLHLAVLALEACSLVAFLATAFANPAAASSVALLSQPPLLSAGIVGAIAFGMVLPSVFESYSLARKEGRAIPFSDVICLIGSFYLRWCVIMGGIH